jgi:hypothetical protein
MRLSLENAEQELKEFRGKIRRAQGEVEHSSEVVSSSAEARLKLEKQLLESRVTCNCSISENQQLKASLDRAITAPSELAGSLRVEGTASHALIANESGDLKHEDEAEYSYEDLSVEEVKNKECSPHEQVETLNDVRDEQIESHEGTHDFLFVSDQAGFQLDEFPSPRSSSNFSDAEVPGITEVNQVHCGSQDTFLNEADVQSEGPAFSVVMGMQVPG